MSSSFDIFEDPPPTPRLSASRIQDVTRSVLTPQHRSTTYRAELAVPTLTRFLGDLASYDWPCSVTQGNGRQGRQLVNVVVTSLKGTSPLLFVRHFGHWVAGNLILFLAHESALYHQKEPRSSVRVDMVRWIRFCRLLLLQDRIAELENLSCWHRSAETSSSLEEMTARCARGVEALKLSDSEKHLYARMLRKMDVATGSDTAPPLLTSSPRFLR